jgi:hypothetical protein
MAVTQRARLTLDQIEVTLGGFDDDCPGRVLRAIKHCLPLKIRRKLVVRPDRPRSGRCSGRWPVDLESERGSLFTTPYYP